MKNKIKNLVMNLSVLFAIGLVLAIIGNAIGAGAMLQGPPKIVITEMIVNPDGSGQVTMSADGEPAQNITMNKTEVDKQKKEMGILNESERVAKATQRREYLNNFYEIAKRDKRVQELIEGKEYEAGGYTPFLDQDGNIYTDTISINFEIEGKHYRVKINITNETVESIEELPDVERVERGEPMLQDDEIVFISSMDLRKMRGFSDEYPEDIMSAWKGASDKLFEIAKRDEKMQEFINGKEYKVLGSTNAFRLRGIDGKTITDAILVIGTEENLSHRNLFYVIVNMDSETVKTVCSLEKLREIAGKDAGLKDLIEGGKYQVTYSSVTESIKNGKITNDASLSLEDKGYYYNIFINLDNETVTSSRKSEKWEFMMQDNQFTAYTRGELVKNVTVPDGSEYVFELPFKNDNSDCRVPGADGFCEKPLPVIKIKDERSEKHKKICSSPTFGDESCEELIELLEIAKKDSRVQELIEGREYLLVTRGSDISGISFLKIDVEGERYTIIVNRLDKTVKAVGKYTEIDDPFRFSTG